MKSLSLRSLWRLGTGKLPNSLGNHPRFRQRGGSAEVIVIEFCDIFEDVRCLNVENPILHHQRCLKGPGLTRMQPFAMPSLAVSCLSTFPWGRSEWERGVRDIRTAGGQDTEQTGQLRSNVGPYAALEKMFADPRPNPVVEGAFLRPPARIGSF